MNDNLTRYFAIQKALKSLRPTEPKGNVARHLNTLAMMISGIIGSQKCHLPAIAKSVNERDGLGDDLVPDYLTRVKEGGFYGWSWYYLGPHQDPRHPGEHPELKDKVLVPDVLVTSHMASLGMTFYTGKQFPSEYHEDGFAAQHGSWNRVRRVGYEVIRVPLKRGVPNGEYEDFMTGFVTPDGNPWGRPVGVTVAQDGALIVTDDGSGTVWRIVHKG